MEISDEPLIHDQFEFRHADTPVLPSSRRGRLSGGGYPHLSSPARWTTAGARGGWGHTAPREASAMLAERYVACAGAPARTRGSCRAGGRAGPSAAFGRVPRCAARFETTASGHAVRSVSTRASGPVVDAAFGVEGGGYLEVDGGARLEGVARVGGAKNAVLALLAGALACREPVTIRGVPLLKDVMSMIDVLRSVGARVHIGVDGPDTVTVDARALDSHSPDPAAVEKLRASFFAAGPILARLGRVEMPLPGGCAIGARPVDLHLHGFEALGAEVHVTPEGTVIAVATGPGGRLRGAGVVTLRFPSVGATHAVVAAAALAEGDTIIEGAAAEPEVADLAAMLNAAGAKITGAGTPTVRIRGVGGGGGRGGEGGGRGDVSGLRGCVHDAIPDRVEAGTFLVAAACTGSSLELYPVVSAHLTATIDVLRAAGCDARFESGPGPRDTPAPAYATGRRRSLGAPPLERLVLTPPAGGARGLSAVDFTTRPYPGVPTDMQPQLCVLAATAKGTSTIRETVFENRFSHVEELAKMGCDARRGADEREVVIRGTGGGSLRAADVRGSDLRASAALVLAGLVADGTTRVEGLRHLDRGYERLDEKLAGLGAVVRRVEPP